MTRLDGEAFRPASLSRQTSIRSWWRSLLGLLLVVGLGAGCGGNNPDVETDPESTLADEEFQEIDVTDVDEQPDFGTGESLGDAGVTTEDLEPERTPMPTVRDVFFAYDSESLDAEARATLEANARILRDRDDITVLIEGHCDERGTAQYNMALGWRRAEAVRNYLVRLQVPEDRLRTTSFGKEKPFVTGTGEEAWSQNRRAHFNLSYFE